MRCPICKWETLYAGNPYRPFCSERCRWLDLDNWLSERYRISTPIETREKAGGTPQPDRSAEGDCE